jgi:hypothetical protein
MKKHDPNRYLTHITKTEKQTNYNYRLKVNDRLNKAFDMIPSNAIINKGRCGIGGTYLEIKALRNSIIVVPTNAIIDNKCFDIEGKLLTNYYVVRGKKKKIKFQELRDFIKSDSQVKKIFCTPEGLDKIMKCGIDLTSIYKNWFLLLDECHTYITDNFRERILIPFKYLFKFDKKALISATPYYFSDPRFETFDMYNIAFRGKVSKIEVLHTNDVHSVLFTMLTNPEQFPGRVHIFLNSVNKIAETIRAAELKLCSIFCKGDRKNMDKLDELRGFFKEHPVDSNFSKLNFYTSKYFEGWDLKDFNATLIIISDYMNLTLRSGVSNKCVQASGRNRLYSNKIIHLTNSRGLNFEEPIEVLKDRMLMQANSAILRYNQHLLDTIKDETQVNAQSRLAVLQYGDEDHVTKFISLNFTKLDQIINCDYSHQEFNHIGFIVTAWKHAYFNTARKTSIVPKIPEFNKRLNKLNRVLYTISYLDELESNDEQNFPNYKQLARLLPVETENIIEAYYEIGPARMELLEYNLKLIREAVIKSVNVRKKELVKKEYWNEVGIEFRTTDEITKMLLRLYTKHGVYNPKKSANEPMSVFGTTLDELFTDVKQTRNKEKIHGRYINIY